LLRRQRLFIDTQQLSDQKTGNYHENFRKRWFVEIREEIYKFVAKQLAEEKTFGAYKVISLLKNPSLNCSFVRCRV